MMIDANSDIASRPIDFVLRHLHSAQRNHSGWEAHCPGHDDQRESLSVNEGADGRVLLHCHAGCSVEQIVTAIGLSLKDLFPKKEKRERTIIAVYPYYDEERNLLYEVVRFSPKGFAQRKPDGTWGLNGGRRVLYHLPRLVMAETIYIVEGEKDADRLWSLGIPATTNAGGAGKWRDEYSESLRGKRVVILPDNDPIGEQHAQTVARSLLGKVSAVKIVRLPELPVKGDVSDWLNTGHTKDELVALVTATPVLKPEDLNAAQPPRNSLTLTKLSDLLNEPEEQVAWLVDNLLPSGGFSLLVAKPKAGKSTLARNLALSVSRGELFLNKPTQQGPVIYLALEEKRSEVRKHFKEMGATGKEEIYIFAASAPVDALQQVRAIVEEKKPVLLIIDPLFRFTRVKDGNDYAQVTGALEPLLVLARETGAHVSCAHHAGKGEREGGDSILGSTAIFAAVDTALIMKRSERYRTISSQQRYGEDLPESVLYFNQQTRVLSLGETKDREEGKRLEDAILACLKAQEEDQKKGHALTQAELDEEVEGKTTYKRRALKALVDGKQLERLGKGGKKEPFHYCLKDSRFLVLVYSKEHGNKNRKNDPTPEEDSPYSCSRQQDGSSDSAKTQEPAKSVRSKELF